jgi:hypothetical protein
MRPNREQVRGPRTLREGTHRLKSGSTQFDIPHRHRIAITESRGDLIHA